MNNMIFSDTVSSKEKYLEGIITMRIPEYHRKNSERYALSFSVTETVAPTSVPPHPENPRPVTPYTFGDQEQFAWVLLKQSELHESK